MNSKSHLFALDGFRALLALWVYLGHLADVCGYSNRLFALHPLAVDLFMVLSGFLMVHTWKRDVDETNYFSKNTVNFYISRFFRIAPLYYLLLLICYVYGTSLGHMHDVILKALPPPWAYSIANFDPYTDWSFEGLHWLWLHISFIFGVYPGMENNSPLPDWSLSLEMQFYLVFPLLLVITKKIPILIISIIVAIASFYSPTLFGNYLDAGIFSHFGQPSFLPYRLNAFFAGMLVAFWLNSHTTINQKYFPNLFFLFAAFISVLPLSKPVVLLYVLFVLICSGKYLYLNKFFDLSILRHIGNFSYSLYLCHILIIYPIVYLLITHTDFLLLSSIKRFMIGLIFTLPLVIIFSHLLFKYVELPSIRFGKLITNKLS